MGKLAEKSRSCLKSLERVFFEAINEFLSYLVGKTGFAWWIFYIFVRILPVPVVRVRGVPIRVIIALNEVGVYNTVKIWEERELEVLDWIDQFEPGCTFFDIGASFGTETLYAALKQNGPEKIVAFDLSLPASFNLAYNINLNNITKVEQYYLALADGLKLLTFSEPSQYFSVKGREKHDKITYKTLSISLDQFIQMTGITPDYIKIDVDGGEENLILGMAEIVRNPRLKSVVIEVSEKSEAAVTPFFQNAGFSAVYERIVGEEEQQFFKNIIFRKNPSC
ncbi:MAG: FkbM family methyltransferase [Syntrophobacterales bacterium]|jgi:FkbM family methyltransferase|nr:FkbM family methyltransferase [Syntrophobacterales bacterium]